MPERFTCGKMRWPRNHTKKHEKELPAAIIATDSTDEHGFYFACGKKGWPRIGAKQTRKENACGNYRQRMARMNSDFILPAAKVVATK